MEHEIDDTISALAGLTDGEIYTIKNDSDELVYIQLAASAPDNLEDMFRIGKSDAIAISKTSGKEIYCYARHNTRVTVYLQSELKL